MRHIERLKQRVLKRPDSPARPESDRSSSSTQSVGPTEPDQPSTTPKYGLFEFELRQNQPNPPGPEQFLVDIIAVHGLGGDAYKTWTHPVTNKLWLRDFIPEFLPGCRVYTFGYPSKLKDIDTRARVQEYGRKLVSSVRDHLEGSRKVGSPIHLLEFSVVLSDIGARQPAPLYLYAIVSVALFANRSIPLRSTLSIY
jgi:hypothetical protein